MEFEIFDISKIEELKIDLEVESDPFSSKKNKRFFSKLHLLAEKEPEKYSSLEKEMESLKSSLSLAINQQSESSENLKNLLDKIVEQQDLADQYQDEISSITEEIEDLEEEYFNLPDSDERDDQMIESAMRLLIDGKKHKLDGISNAFPVGVEGRKENIKTFYAKKAEFDKASEDLVAMTEAVERNLEKIKSINVEMKAKPSVSQKQKKAKEKENSTSLETQALDGIIPANAIKKNKYKKLLGK